jgi:hypothetical protein
VNTKNTKKINYLHVISDGKATKESSQVPWNKSPKIFHQNIRGLSIKTNELYCHLHRDLPHILYLPEHHLRESELQLTYVTNYSVEPATVGKLFLKEVSVYLFTET